MKYGGYWTQKHFEGAKMIRSIGENLS
jgi:hypothetical protein